MMDYKEAYKRKLEKMGNNTYQRNFKSKCREFEIYFRNALNKEECYLNGSGIEAIFQDHSQSNNKDLSDDKYVILPNSTACGVGDYINWRGQDWLVFTEEFKTINTHQQLKIKIVNERIKWIKDGKICNDGIGWGAYVQNQTLYTLGVSSAGNHISVINAKMMLYMQDNEETRRLKILDRIFIGSNVYQIMFADTVSRSGLINFLLEEDTMGENDNQELRIADYYKKIAPKEEDEKEDKESPVINGELKPKVGRTYVYEISSENKVLEWAIESLESEYPADILERSDERVSITIKNDNRLIGTQLTIIAKVDGFGYVSKPVKIVKRF